MKLFGKELSKEDSSNLELGLEGRDKVTGFTGILTSRVTYLTGSGSVMKDNKPSYIIPGHGWCWAGDFIWKTVPGYGRCKFVVTEGGGLSRIS